jgi:hypothetical protein
VTSLRFLAIVGIAILALYLALAAALRWGLIDHCDPDFTPEECARLDRAAGARAQ